MFREQIIELAEAYINQALEGHHIENPKLDFKREWYDLSESNDINEFIKDTSAIANSVGPDGFIIIGVDEKGRKQIATSFQDCKLDDSNKLPGIINKKVDRPFDLNYYEATINNHLTGILHIPPSLDKPHVIRNYQKFDKKGNCKDYENSIFVRSGTITKNASKYDLELMYYDRKNIHPDYVLELSINKLTFWTPDTDTLKPARAFAKASLENSGRRPAAINFLKLTLYFSNGEKISLTSPSVEFENQPSTFIGHRNIIVKANDMVQVDFDFACHIAQPNPEYRQPDLRILENTKHFISRIEVEFTLKNEKTIINDCVPVFY